MKLLADENIRRDLVEWQRESGHDVAWIVEDQPGSADLDIIDRSTQESRIILSADLDFGELVVLHGHSAPGIVILRLGTLAPDDILRVFRDQWSQIEKDIPLHIIVLTPHRIRVRPIRTK